MGNVDYDLVIIGAGPAGLTAGMYAARARLKVKMIEKVIPGGQIIITDWVENYPGFPEGISGFELSDKMKQQAEEFGVEIDSDEVVSMDLDNKIKKIKLLDSEITTHAVIIASGASPKKIGIPGENEYFGKGVSTCATCDAPFYKDKVVVAVGGGDTAVEESIYLAKFVKKVYLVHRRDELRAAKISQERAFANEKIEFVWDTVPTAINGSSGSLESISLKNVKSGEEKDLDIDGCFIWVGLIPNTEFIGDSIEKDDQGFIVVDKYMQTSMPGVFAAGDVRDTPLRQIATAVGDSAIAANSVIHYIENL
jgi:thioredoxin reductase (NADPH)